MSNLSFTNVYLDYNAQLENYQFAGTDLDIDPTASYANYYTINTLAASDKFKWQFTILVSDLLDDG